MKTIYENEEYFVCESLEELTGKLLNYRKAVLVSDLNTFKSQYAEIFKVIGNRFGSESEELKKVFSPKIFCGSCGVAFSQAFLLKITMPEHQISGISKNIEGCPKCGSQRLTIIYKF
jgi:hypothetical protein